MKDNDGSGDKIFSNQPPHVPHRSVHGVVRIRAAKHAPVPMRMGKPELLVPRHTTRRVRPASFTPTQLSPAAAAFFGAAGVSDAGLAPILASGIPILPIASADGFISSEIPVPLKALNCLTVATHGLARIATAVLECVGLLPRRRIAAYPGLRRKRLAAWREEFGLSRRTAKFARTRSRRGARWK